MNPLCGLTFVKWFVKNWHIYVYAQIFLEPASGGVVQPRHLPFATQKKKLEMSSWHGAVDISGFWLQLEALLCRNWPAFEPLQAVCLWDVGGARGSPPCFSRRLRKCASNFQSRQPFSATMKRLDAKLVKLTLTDNVSTDPIDADLLLRFWALTLTLLIVSGSGVLLWTVGLFLCLVWFTEVERRLFFTAIQGYGPVLW